MSEASELGTAPPFPTRKRWIRWSRLGDYQDVGVNEDGTLRNPNGYPEGLVCEAIAGALEEERQQRRASAKIASTTRAERHEKLLHQAAQRVLEGLQVANSTHCDICKKYLTDAQSIARGIGPECWQGVLGRIDWMRRERGEIPTPENNQGQLWGWRLGRWERFPRLDTTDTHVLVHEKARTVGGWTTPQDIRALDRAALEINGWAEHAAKPIYRGGRYFTDAGKAEVDRRRAGPIVYPLLGLPAGLPRPFIEAAHSRASQALTEATGKLLRDASASQEVRMAALAREREQRRQMGEERKDALMDGDRPLVA